MNGRNSTRVSVRLQDTAIEKIKKEAEPEQLSVGLWIKKLVEDTVGWKPPIVEESS
jgi:predicted DNA binding CopG/RHH family protein